VVETPEHSTDLEAIADGYVSVSPLHLDLTHDPSLDALQKRLAAGTPEGSSRET
jgi:5'-nucleotidase